MPRAVLYPEEDVEKVHETVGGAAFSVPGDVRPSDIEDTERLFLSVVEETLREAVGLVCCAGFVLLVQTGKLPKSELPNYFSVRSYLNQF